MSEEVIRLPLGALSKESRHALALSRPLSDHPAYRGPRIAGQPDVHISPMTVAGSLSVVAVGVAALCGVFDSVGQGLVAVVLAPIIVAVLVRLLILVRTRSSQTHKAVTKLLADPSPEDSTLAVHFHTDANISGDRVVTAVSIPAHEHKWTLSFVAAAQVTEILEKHSVIGNGVAHVAMPIDVHASQPKCAETLEELSQQAAQRASRTDGKLSASIRTHCCDLSEALSTAATTDSFDPGRACPAATAVRLIHDQAIEALKVYSHVPESAVHVPLASGKTPTEELVETLATLSAEATSTANDAVQLHANKLSQLRRYASDKYYRSELDH